MRFCGRAAITDAIWPWRVREISSRCSSPPLLFTCGRADGSVGLPVCLRWSCFCSLPPVLAHAGVATLDLFCVAGLLTALYNVLRWLDEPTTRRAIFMGAAVAFALMVKFSNAAFLGVCCPVALMCWYFATRPGATPKEVIRPRLVQIAIASGVMVFLIWASYRFPLPGTPGSTAISMRIIPVV